ncbi:MerR family transcriptional regulator [Tsukamurella soli]|uniref:HTH merR-type domain-containing protein n=1 Tax=Tsukamurella soli TaxID=644556 RepID=A0ABP8KC69_9ACTN
MDITLLTKGQVARRLGLSPERVRQLSESGALACQHTPLGRLYDPDEVDRYAATRAADTRRSHRSVERRDSSSRDGGADGE